jgi:hypothetical protein
MKDSRAVVDGPGPGLIPGGGVERVGPRQSPSAAKGDGPKATGPSRAARARENQAGTPPKKADSENQPWHRPPVWQHGRFPRGVRGLALPCSALSCAGYPP